MIYIWSNDPPSAGKLQAGFFSNGGYIEIFFAGSAYSDIAPSIIGADLLIDGTLMATAQVWTNERASHKALVPVSTAVRLPRGPHTVEIFPMSPNSKIDHNDRFTLTLDEFVVSAELIG